MPVRTPYHSTMEKEIEKAAKIVDAFFDSTLDADSAIPADLIRQCSGLAFLTVVKAGMIWTGKIGTGVVIARLPDGSWSPPSGIGTAGVGFGAEFGGELIDFMIVLGSPTAVQTFKKGTQVSLGAGLDLAVGPIGRTAGANINAGRGGFSGNYTYSHSKGMFAGVGLHGSTIIVRSDLNARFYGRDVTPMEILNGHVQTPAGACDGLYGAIERAINSDAGGVFATDFQSRTSAPSGYPAMGMGAPTASASPNEATQPVRASSFDNGRSRRSSDSSSSQRQRSATTTTTSNLPPPTMAAPIENDPRLRRYGSYKSERELYAEFAKKKASTPSTTDYTSGYTAAASAASATYTKAEPSAPAASAAGYAVGYGASGYGAPPAAPTPQYTAPAQYTTPAPQYGAPTPQYSAPTPQYAQPSAPAPTPVPVAQVNYVPASAYAPRAPQPPPAPAPVVPRSQAPPIPAPTSGAETKRVYTGVMKYVTMQCPLADLQLFKDNCRRFGQDQMSLDAYFAYLTSICTNEELKQLMPQLVRLLPTQDKRENLWGLYVKNVLMIR